jgi:hypothetical protein
MTALAPQATANVGFVGTYRPLYPLEKRMSGLRGKLRVRGWPYARFYITKITGDCLPIAGFAILDREGDIMEGNLFSFGVRDWREAFGHYGPSITGVIKRFRGVNHERKVLECDCANPPLVIHTGTATNLLYAHVVRAIAPTYWEALKLLWRVRLNPDAFDPPRLA